MKEFDKWWNKEIRPYIHNPKDKDVVKEGWKQALEWALRNFDGETDMLILRLKIDNELQE